MSTVAFGGVVIKNWQTPRKTLTRETKEADLISEKTHVSRSSRVMEFPKEFECYADTDTEMEAVEALISADYSTLIVDGQSYSNCYVYQISDIWEVREGSGTWTFSIEFRQADVHG
ncbi:MAG: hypothetical protein ABFD07_16355 [Methanobacterium sp.]